VRSATTPVVNDFSIQIATVNGSGSQTANLVLLRSLFQTGVPVSGKNLFPSNIAGLPTWFTIRASRHGYIGRKKEIDILVAMNPETARDDVLGLGPGAVALYDEPLKLNEVRDDLVFYPVPFDKLVATVCPDAKMRKLVRNMIYDGVLARLLNIDLAQMEQALGKQLAKKARTMALNMAALQAGFSWASTTVGGIGERAGNASFAEVAMAARYLCGRTLNLNAAELPALAALVARASGIPVPACAPVVGSRAFAHESGVHVDGTLKAPRAYEPYDPADIGVRRRLVLGAQSGRASLRAAAAAFDLDVTEEELVALVEVVRSSAVPGGRSPAGSRSRYQVPAA